MSESLAFPMRLLGDYKSRSPRLPGEPGALGVQAFFPALIAATARAAAMGARRYNCGKSRSRDCCDLRHNLHPLFSI